MSEINPESLSCTDLLKRAMQAHWPAEKATENLAKALREPVRMLYPPNGGKPISTTGPSERETLCLIAGALHISMQTQRLMFAALEGIAIQIESMNQPLKENESDAANVRAN